MKKQYQIKIKTIDNIKYINVKAETDKEAIINAIDDIESIVLVEIMSTIQ